MRQEKKRISDVDIDHILEQVHEQQKMTGGLLENSGENHEDELDSILSSLGMGEKQQRPYAQFSSPIQNTGTRPVQLVQPAPALGKFVEPPMMAIPHEKPVQPVSDIPAKRAVPVQQSNETEEASTLELPTMKAFSDAQEKRKSDIETAAVQAAFTRAGIAVPSAVTDKAEQTVSKNTISQPLNNAMFGEVDDRFRAFFSKTVAQDSPAAEQAAFESQKKKRNRFKTFLTRAVRDEDEAFLTGEFDVHPARPAEKVSVEIKRDADVPQQTNEKAAALAATFAAGDPTTGELPVLKKSGQFKSYTITMPLAGDGTEDNLPRQSRGQSAGYAEMDANEYNHLADAPAVTASLKNMRVTRILRMAATGLVTLILLYFGLSAHKGGLPPIAMFDPHTEPFAFLLVNFVLLALAALICLTTMGAGLAGLVRKPTTDTLPALATVAALLQNLVYLFTAASFNPEKITLFAPIATLLLFSNTLGKWLQSKIISDNFAMASAGFDHAAALIVPNQELTRKLCSGIGEANPSLLVSRPAGLVKGFLRQSFSAHSNDPMAQKLSYILCGAALVCGIICGVRTGNFLAALSGFAATFCIGAPLASSLVYAIPAFLLQQKASKVGAVIAGPSAVAELGKTNVVLLNARDLFPASCVRLHGIKTFEKERIDLAILYAASLLVDNCDTLRDTFLALVDNKKNLLYKVENAQTEQGFGFTGWIDNHRVIVGNRGMMSRHDIEIPSLEYEQKYTKNGERSPIYLAVAGKAFGMFLVSYLPDAHAQQVLDDLGHSGINVVLQTDDFNITAPLVGATYRLPLTAVKVLSQQERSLLSVQTDYVPESEGLLTHLGTCTSFIGGLRAAAGAAVGEKLACVVQMAAILFSLLVCAVLSFSLGLAGLSLTAVLLYQLAWCVLTVVLPILKRT
ncbi:MAG: hypothetical protein RR759_02590 [Ruthenibacterium sp.]